MKKLTKNLLLSALAVSTAATAITAVAFNTFTSNKVSASNETEATIAADGFEMVDGASIRMASPLGLRFIAEMGADVYSDLMTAETGVDKKMGMIIVPYEYLSDASQYTNGETDMKAGNYQNLTTKIDHTFYDSTTVTSDDADGKIYEYKEGVYRANGVISNLLLVNYDREFVGIAYIAETSGSTTTYTFASFDKADDVRNATYVAIEAYEDYESTNAREVFSEYVWGAHLETKGMTETATGSGTARTAKYTYNGTEYDSITAAASAAGVSLSVSLDKSIAYIKDIGDAYQLTATIADNGTAVTFDGAHAIWSSSNEDIVTVDKNGKVTAVGNGTTTVTAKFMGTTATCKIISSSVDFEKNSADALLYFTGSRVESFTTETKYNSTVMNVKTHTTSGYGDICVSFDLATISAFFENEEVEYLAFDLLLPENATTTRGVIYYKGTSAWTAYETGTYDAPPTDAFKSYYLTRDIYEAWISNSSTDTRMLMIGSGVSYGMSFWMDNLRGVTADEYLEDMFSFESGGIRTNGTSPLLYIPNNGQWEFNFSGIIEGSHGYTSETVSDGVRAFWFTKNSGATAITLNHTTDTTLETALRAAGYISFDLHVPAGSDAYITNSAGTWKENLQEGWNTVYAKVPETANEIIRFADTTGGTYVVDNIKFITEDEYNDCMWGFEVGAGLIRSTELGDDTANGGVFYYYSSDDVTNGTYSFAFKEGSSDTDVAALSNPRLDYNVYHSGNSSLAFDKGSGYMYAAMRSDSTAYANFGNGFAFWIYSTVEIDGVNTTNFINGKNGKFNGGAGITIPANTWTRVIVTTDDKDPTRFLIMQGSWTGTIYIDDIAPVTTSTITYDAGDGSLDSTTQSVVYGEAYTLATPTYYLGDFLGWEDADGNPVATSGVWNYTNDITLYATYSKKVSFENGVVPTYLTKSGTTETLSVVETDATDGDYALKLQSTASGTSPGLYATVEFLAAFFEDSSVDYIAFDAKTGVSNNNNFRRSTIRTTGSSAGNWGQETYESDYAPEDTGAVTGVRCDAYKTFFFTRLDYENWANNSVTEDYLISTGGMTAGDYILIDNIRKATAAEYTAAKYSLDNGGTRLNGGDLMMYLAEDTSTWQFGVTNGGTAFTSSSYGYTSEAVSDGVRAFWFKATANETQVIRFNSSSVALYTGVAETGYYSFDLYVPADSDVTLTYNTTNYPGATPISGGWTTIYVSNSTTCVKLTDTTGSTYMIDNLRALTEDEYNAAAYSFEAGTGGLRDNITTAITPTAYYYAGADHSANTYSFCVTGSTLTAVSISTEQVCDGKYSLSFTKTAGALTLQMRNDTTAYATLKHGFTFWLYTTVAINGVGTQNFINGNSSLLNGGEGMMIGANTWTQITITKDDITHNLTNTGDACPFLRLNGSTAGTYYIDKIEALPYEEPVTLTYNATVESNNADVATETRTGITLAASTHTGTQSSLPMESTTTKNMSYIRFGGSYGLDDYLVFDFTGDNIPIISFFNNNVTNTIFNQTADDAGYNATVKGYVFANGMTTPQRGQTYGGLTGAHANRLTVHGPYQINMYDSDVTGQIRAQNGKDASDPDPISMASLKSVSNPYRMIIGFTANTSDSSYMNLRVVVIDLVTGEEVVNYNLHYSMPVATWEGDIALFGHFGRETYLDALYPIVEGSSIDEVVAKYMPSTIIYEGELNGDGLEDLQEDGVTLAAGTHEGNPNKPTAGSTDMSYIAFNGNYGLNDYVVFDMTGDNMPIISFFNNEVTNTVFNNSTETETVDSKTYTLPADENAKGWVLFSGLYKQGGSVYGGLGGTHSCRITLIGKQKVITYDDDSNSHSGGFRLNWGSTGDVHPLSIYALQNVTDTYRVIVGIGANSSSAVYLEIGVINMVTGEVIYQQQLKVSNTNYQEGSIALHGQFGRETKLDKVFGIEQDTTLDALMAKYGVHDTDYSNEEAVTLDRYAYASLSDGNWTIDGTEQETDPTDFRLEESAYTTYKDAGFNIVLAQDMISPDNGTDDWNNNGSKYMDMAYNAGLKVILTDWHLQVISTPLKVSGTSVVASDSTYVPWIIGTDANATEGAAATYLGYLSDLGITADTTRFATREALDAFVYDQLALYKDHPAFYGVMLGDEPCYHNAYCYGEVYNSIKRVMSKCYVQYNLLPLENSFGTIQYRYPGLGSYDSDNLPSNINSIIEEAYTNYVTSFLDTMNTDYVQYDDYPFKSSTESYLGGLWTKTDPYVDKTSLRNIQLIAEIAKERGLDVKVVSQSSVMKTGGASGYTHIRQVTEDDARWLNNYLMGFGVKQINYFTYWTKRASSASGEYFVDGGSFVNRDGTTTDLYTFMQTIMADNTAFAPTISHFNYKTSQVFGSDNDSDLNNDHISWSSSLTATASFRWISSITTSLEYTLVTELYDKDNYNYMYMVMNTIDPSEGGTQSITVTLDSSITSFYVYDQRGNRTEHTGNSYTVSLTAGQAVYIMPCAW